MKVSLFFVPVLFCAITVNPANAHLHVSVGVEANKLQFVTYGNPSMSILPSRHVGTTSTNQPLVRALNGYAIAAPFAGYRTGASTTITTDLYDAGAQNPLNGADVWIEFASVLPVGSGAVEGNVAGFSIPLGDGPYQDAMTNGATLADRSVDMDVGTHYHGSSLYSLYGGVYDVQLIAHDLRTNGTSFASSVPIYLRINAIPEPASVSLLATGAMAFLRRKRRANPR